jgi:putative transport protein
MSTSLARFAEQSPVAHAILILCLVIVAGLVLGRWRVRGIGLGTAGVLFAGLAAAHAGFHPDAHILEFTREFGLILFVFTIGLQLGPGFFASLRRQGLRLNALAAGVVLGGGVLAWACVRLLGVDAFAGPGLFSGSTTNTPSLGAAQDALRILGVGDPAHNALPALAYAVAYPAGIAGILASLLILKRVFRIDPEAEAVRYKAEAEAGVRPLERRTLVVDNAHLNGVMLANVPSRRETGVVVSRVRRAAGGEVFTAQEDTVLQTGDLILAIGTRENLDQFQMVVGAPSTTDLLTIPSRVNYRRVSVTHKAVLGRTLRELGLQETHEVTVTRIQRAGVEMTAVPDLRLQFGDILQLVGEEMQLVHASAVLGNSPRALNETQFIGVFLGIAAGIAGGLIPFAVPGLPVPVRLGIAGGPLLAAILFSRLGHLGPVVWHMPANANLALREMGIMLFLACVGLKAGTRFFEVVFTPAGLAWMGCALLISMVPLLVAGIFARRVWNLNFMPLCGVLSGSMTDPPALAFACGLGKSDAPSVAYATVYPLAMFLRILVAQVLAIVLCGG